MEETRTLDARATLASQVLHDNVFRALRIHFDVQVDREARLDMVKSGARIIEICLRLDPNVDADETMARLKEFQNPDEDSDETES